MGDQQDVFHSFRCQGALINVKIGEGALKAFIEIKAAPKPNETDEEITQETFDSEKFQTEVCNWIETLIPEEVIDPKTLQQALDLYKDQGSAKERRIAQGVSPQNGTNGKFVLLVKPYTEKFEGVYSFTERFQKRFDVILKGSVVARVYRPKAGADGRDLFLKAIPHSPGIPYELELSENLYLTSREDQNYDEIIANEDGYITCENDVKSNKARISLETFLKFRNGIDHKTGSVSFVNSILVEGDIKEGFKVEATKDIVIKGNISHSNVVSKEGSIEILGTVIGDDVGDEGLNSLLKGKFEGKSTINAHTFVKAKAIQNIRVVAGGLVEVQGSIVRSQVYSATSVICLGGIYASKISTACGVEAKTFGNESGVLTIVDFLHPVEAGLEYLSKQETLERLLERKEKLGLFIGPYLKDQKALARLSSEHKAKIKLALNETSSLMEQVTKIEQELSSLKEEAKTLKTCQLNSLEKCYQNVLVRTEKGEYSFNETKKGKFSLFFDWADSRFFIEEYKPIVCELLEGAK